jgi:hypothetical protein
MVFDPESAKHDNPPQQSDAAPAYYSKSSIENQPLPVNADGLAKQLEWVGVDPAEARKL